MRGGFGSRTHSHGRCRLGFGGRWCCADRVSPLPLIGTEKVTRVSDLRPRSRFASMHPPLGNVLFILPAVTLVLLDSLGYLGDTVTTQLVSCMSALVGVWGFVTSVSYTHLRAHETGRNLVCRLLLEK